MHVNKIQYVSDLHLEFSENENYLKLNPIIPNGNILLLAGDIIPFEFINRVNYFFDYLSNNFQAVYWVPGNHEYYHFDLSLRFGQLFEKIRSNVFLVNNFVVEHENIKFIFSTLWSTISDKQKGYIEKAMNDFRMIKYKGTIFSTDHSNQLHNTSIEFIENELQNNKSANTIVVSHHVPTFKNYPEIYKNSFLNEGFVVELSKIIETHEPNYWVYGHHHYNTEDFQIGKTKMLTNQLGYVNKNEHIFFDSKKIITI